MRLFIRVLLMLCASGNLLGAFAQDTSVQSGFAIVTLTSGNVAGLVATESLNNTNGFGVEQAIVAPSVLITAASVLVPLGADNTTGIAITNPSQGSGNVNLILTDQLGNVVLNTIVPLGPLGHFTRFLNEFFAAQPSGFSTPLLLTVSSEIPIAVLVLNFRADSIASIPLTSLSFPTPVPSQTLTVIPGTQAPTTLPTTLSPTPGFGLGMPPVTQPVMAVTPPVTTSTSLVPTTISIGGAASLVFAQVVTGGDWSTQIAIGNTSAGTQNIRIDFFRSDGINTTSLTDIAIPPHGVFFVSSSQLLNQ